MGINAATLFSSDMMAVVLASLSLFELLKLVHYAEAGKRGIAQEDITRSRKTLLAEA